MVEWRIDQLQGFARSSGSLSGIWECDLDNGILKIVEVLGRRGHTHCSTQVGWAIGLSLSVDEVISHRYSGGKAAPSTELNQKLLI